MLDLPGPLGTILDLLIVVLGFGAIVFIHELGHFLAARWAGIRVLAFSIGFGPVLASYRKGLGWRRGSAMTKDDVSAVAARPTEYRLSALPLGGYVRMLGQDDMDPSERSDAPDSYQSCPVWKRMVVISAGVVFNLISAAILFCVVFGVGLRTEPPKLGAVAQGSPAAAAEPVLPGVATGLLPGDTVVSIGGDRPQSFSDVVVAAAMARSGSTLRVVVERPGEPTPLTFNVVPKPSDTTNLLGLGVAPAQTLSVYAPRRASARATVADSLSRIGLAGVEPGMTLVDAGRLGVPTSPSDLAARVEASDGSETVLTFADADGRSMAVRVRPVARLQTALVDMPRGAVSPQEHLLGLTGVLAVAREADPEAVGQGLRPGDVFARIGTVEWPGVTAGIRTIREHSGRSLEVVVQRTAADGTTALVPLTVQVSRQGTIGFAAEDTSAYAPLLSTPLAAARPLGAQPDAAPSRTAAADLGVRPGTRVREVGGRAVSDFAELRAALRAAVPPSGGTVTLRVEPPATRAERASGAPPTTQTVEWTLGAEDAAALHALGWSLPFATAIFAEEQVLLRADGPLGAIGMGVRETRRVMLQTYLTFARLFQGSVRVEHLKGPVGIAHLGTRIAERGPVWLLFFAALISVNLAVINFLPLPIVDGGQFLMLVYEWIRGRPVPVGVQNAVTLAGLVLIGSMFLIVTFNDVRNLLGL